MYFLTENGNYLTKIGSSLLETETPIYQEDLNFDYVETHSFIFDEEDKTTEFILSPTNESFGIFDDLTEMKFFEGTRNIDKYEVSKGSPYLPYPREEIESILKIDPLSKDQEVIKMPEINRAWEITTITTITTNKDSNNTQITEDTESFAWIGAAKIKLLEEYRGFYPNQRTHPLEDLFDEGTRNIIDEIGGEEVFLKQYEIHDQLEEIANNPDLKVVGDIDQVKIYSKHTKEELLTLELKEINSKSMIYDAEDLIHDHSSQVFINVTSKEQQKEQNIKNFKKRALKQFQLDYKAINEKLKQYKKLEQKDDDFYINRSLLVRATDFIKNNIDPEKYQNLPKDQRLAISAFSSSRNPDLRDHFEVLKNKFKAKPKEDQR